MDFAQDIEDGHYGPRYVSLTQISELELRYTPRKFWRNCLPRLKYHNPAIPMTINRTNDQLGPALLTVHFTSTAEAATTKPEVSSTTSKHTSTGPVPASKSGPGTERTEVINMKHRLDSEILDQLLKLTKAKIVLPTPEETRQIREIEEQNAKSARDAAMMQVENAKRKREEEILKQARGTLETN
jgi:large subunit ribosomal protein MRP49